MSRETYFKTIIRKLVQRLAKSYIKKLQTVYEYPNMAIFSNDGLGQTVVAEGWTERYFLEQLSKRIFPNINCKSVALDLGANIGNHSLWFAQHFAEVHSFEPNMRSFLLLKANAMLASNISVHNVGCSNESATEQLALFSKGNIGGARLKSFTQNETLLETTFFDLIRLDDYLPQDLHDKISFIKCDVEGHEVQALQGAEKIILASGPVIAFEVNDFEGVWKYLSSLGYSHYYGIVKFRGLKTISSLSSILKIIPISNDNLTQVYRDLVIASPKQLKFDYS